MFSFLAAASPARSSDFYAGQELHFIIRAAPGGNYDIYSRVLARHLVDHIPGRPTALPINMPGASGMPALAYVAKTAPPDGTYLTMVTPSFPMEQTLGVNKNLNIDFNAMNWIGNLSNSNTFLLTSKNSPTKSLDIARTRTTLVGVPSQEDVTAYMTLLMNKILGTRFRLVAGYTSGPEMNLAMRRGEIEARGTTEPQTLLKASAGADLRDEFNFIVQMGLQKDPKYPDAPLLINLAPDAKAKAAFRFFSEAGSISRPIATGPGVPVERVQILRTAFDETMKDSAFLADSNKAAIQISPMAGATVQRIVANIIAAHKETLNFVRNTLQAH